MGSRYDRALAIYMNLGDKSVFQLIDRYRLFPQVHGRPASSNRCQRIFTIYHLF